MVAEAAISQTAQAGLMAEARMRPAWWRPRAPRQVRVDQHGVWHFQNAQGVWRDMLPTRIEVGPGYRWLTLAGPPGSRLGGCWQTTLWAGAATPAAWRTLRIAAVWRMQRGESGA